MELVVDSRPREGFRWWWWGSNNRTYLGELKADLPVEGSSGVGGRAPEAKQLAKA